jgi:hypothetical protein
MGINGPFRGKCVLVGKEELEETLDRLAKCVHLFLPLFR